MWKFSRKVARLLLYSICISSRSRPLLGHQYTTLLEALKPAPSIPCYSTQVNAIKQLLYYQETWGALLRDAGSLMQRVKLCVTFEGSHTKTQWLPQRRIKAKRTEHTHRHFILWKVFSPQNSKHFRQRSKAATVASFLLCLTEHISELVSELVSDWAREWVSEYKTVENLLKENIFKIS